jgi:hypothetical protein
MHAASQKPQCAHAQVRFLARGFTVSGDHTGQTSTGVRWPYGPVALITPFNFPLEIPVLQLMGALYMGNKPVLHVDRKVSIVIEQFVRLLIKCGMPATDMDLLHGPGTTMGHILQQARPRSTLFTGASRSCPMLCLSGIRFFFDRRRCCLLPRWPLTLPGRFRLSPSPCGHNLRGHNVVAQQCGGPRRFY